MGYWRFDEGSQSTVGDSSAQGNTGTAQNGMGWTAGQVGFAGSFDGLNDQVRMSNSSTLNVTGTGLTITAWVRPTAVNGYRVLVHKERQYSLAILDGQLTYADSVTWSYATMGSYGSVPVGAWSHVAATFDGTTVRLYLNGTEVGTIPRSGSLTATTNALYLGCYDGSAFYLAGGLDEVAVYDRALSAAEVQAIYVSDGGILPTVTATPTATPTNTLPPAATETFTPGLVTATPTVIAPSTATPTSAALPTASFTPTATPNTLMGYWQFNEASGTTVSDSSGHGNTGTAQNGMGWTTGQMGSAGSFDGLNDQVRMPNSSSLDITGTGLTIEAWVRPTAVDGYRVLVHKERQYSLAILNGQLTYADSITWSYATMGSHGTVPVGVWSHVAATFDGATVRFYLNGTEVGAVPRSGSLTATTNALYLGSYNGSAFFLAGGLDEVAVHSRALSGAEVQQHYAAASGADTPTPTPSSPLSSTPTPTQTQVPPTSTATQVVQPTSTETPTATPSTLMGYWRFDEGSLTTVSDSSGQGNTGTAQNGMGWATGHVGSAGSFDGLNDQVRISNSSSLNITGTELTIEAWVRPTAVDGYRVLVHKERQYSLAILNGQLTYADSITWSYATMGSYGTVPVGVWSHVAVTFDGGVVRFYINGIEVGNEARSGSLTATTNALYLGSYNGSAFFVAGRLDEVAVHRRALSASEIQADAGS